MFVGEKHCANCGAAAARARLDTHGERACPRCHRRLHSVAIGEVTVQECDRCDGLWVDNDTFKEICARHEQQVVFLGAPSLQDPLPSVTIEPVRYVKCPSCRQLMNRVNFAGCSGVIVDVCKEHGTWFDRAELRRIIEFIQAGGMDKAREREVRRLVQEQRRLADQRASAGAAATDRSALSGGWTGASSSTELDVIECVGNILRDLLN
jgi:Zn-finger nucleic acid-binding protein